jgi:hypothetical protein
MRFTFEEIKTIVTDEIDTLRHDDEYSATLADSLVPVYYNEILKDWAEMPSEFNDSHQEVGHADEFTVFDLMRQDLFFYYEHQIITALRLVRDELGEEVDA